MHDQETHIQVIGLDQASLLAWRAGIRRELRLRLNAPPPPQWIELFAQDVAGMQFVAADELDEFSPTVRGDGIVCNVAADIDAQRVHDRLRQLVERVDARYRGVQRGDAIA